MAIIHKISKGMVWVPILLALQAGVCLPLEAKLDVVTRILHEVPLIDGHNDLPWNIRKFLKNQLKDFRFSEDLREVAPWSRSAWSHTDLGRLRKGMVAAQFWSAYVPCSSQHLDSVQLTLEQIDVIRRLVAKYPSHMALVTTAQGIKRAHESGRIASLIGIEGGHAIGTSLGVLRMFYQLGARYLTITHTCNTPCCQPKFSAKMKYDMTIALDKKPIPKALNFIFGGVAGMTAAACCHPLDVLKNRMQLAGIGGTAKISAGQVFANIIRTEGMEAMYKGLTASLLRQATYSSARLGVYNGLLQMHRGPQGELPSLGIKASCGMLAGAVGAFIGTPAEVCLIRMTADGRLPPLERRNYTNVFNALARIINEEGITTLFRGFAPTVARGIVVNGIMLSTYSQAKQILIQNVGYKDGISVHVAASMLSGFNTAVTSLPLDIVKTRIQNMKIINGIPEYRGAMDALMKILNKEGVTAFWKGFTPYFSRVGPVAIITFVVLEAIEDFYRNFT